MALACLFALLAAGCRQNMHNQHKVEPYEASAFFRDGQGARPLPEGTVPRGSLGFEIAPYTGLTVSVRPVAGPPPLTPTLLRRGQERYNVFCSPCHDRTGHGQGMIVRRGFKQPTSFHDPRLRSAPADHFVTVMTEGFGVMPSYAPQVTVEERWAIAAYIRALQYSQNARLAEMTPQQRATIAAGLTSPTARGSSIRPDTPRDYDRRPDPRKVP